MGFGCLDGSVAIWHSIISQDTVACSISRVSYRINSTGRYCCYDADVTMPG